VQVAIPTHLEEAMLFLPTRRRAYFYCGNGLETGKNKIQVVTWVNIGEKGFALWKLPIWTCFQEAAQNSEAYYQLNCRYLESLGLHFL
jgi:hypothetical protein